MRGLAALLALALLAACAAREPVGRPAASSVPADAPLDPAIVPLTVEQDRMIAGE
jgi:hypothetical protein